MSMELGLHTADFSQHLTGSEEPRTEVITIICSILILDRQFSAATGLPAQFTSASFDRSITSSVGNKLLTWISYSASILTYYA